MKNKVAGAYLKSTRPENWLVASFGGNASTIWNRVHLLTRAKEILQCALEGDDWNSHEVHLGAETLHSLAKGNGAGVRASLCTAG